MFLRFLPDEVSDIFACYKLACPYRICVHLTLICVLALHFHPQTNIFIRNILNKQKFCVGVTLKGRNSRSLIYVNTIPIEDVCNCLPLTGIIRAPSYVCNKSDRTQHCMMLLYRRNQDQINFYNFLRIILYQCQSIIQNISILYVQILVLVCTSKNNYTSSYKHGSANSWLSSQGPWTVYCGQYCLLEQLCR